MNAAMSWNLLNAFESKDPNARVNPALMRVSYGTLPRSNNIAVEKASAGELLFTWDATRIPDSNPYDQVMLLAYDCEHATAYFNTTGQFRNTGMDVLNIPATKGRTYHLYLAFTAADRSRQSHSVYLGTIES